MKLSAPDAAAYFNAWLEQPLVVRRDASVEEIMDAINAHPIAQDQTAQDCFMPARRYYEEEGRFSVWGENQDNFYCFVPAGAETEVDPPVYFATCLDLVVDHGFDPSEILDGECVLVCETFSAFLWYALAHQICLRVELPEGLYAKGVQGFTFGRDAREFTLDDTFWNPLGRDFPGGATCWISQDTICIPWWGAAFLNGDARERFIRSYAPSISREWGPQS